MPAARPPKSRKSDPAKAAARAAEVSLAQLLREALHPRVLAERRMFGGTCFLLNGNLLCGTFRGDAVFRVGPEAHTEALREPGAQPFVMQDRVAKGWVVVAADTLLTPQEARHWIARALLHVAQLPAK